MIKSCLYVSTSANPRMMLTDELTPRHAAAQNGRDEIVSLLLDYRCIE